MSFVTSPSKQLRAFLGVIAAPQAALGLAGMTFITATAALIGLIASRFGVRFSGFLDINGPLDASVVPMWLAVADQVAALVLAPIAAWLVLKTIRSSARLGRLFLILGILRVPILMSVPVALMITPSAATTHLPLLLGLLVIAFVWFFTWLVTGVRFASGLRGSRLAVAAVSVVVVAEAASAFGLSLLGLAA